MFPETFHINFSIKQDELCKHFYKGFTADVYQLSHEIYSAFVLSSHKRSHWPWIRKVVMD